MYGGRMEEKIFTSGQEIDKITINIQYTLFSFYLPKMLAKNSGIYGKELSNPAVSTEDRFFNFVTQLLDHIDLRQVLKLECK